eukprot:CAMPEP_0203745450 /NCGR_PEP_ID=MMETSP0098-20131031/1181_1 /ASSEMBLY_ACC=CAM_ASM_000208 /TAXON_ID=96639 /ORGANISM=" , Strain NY0313808BC1" /LENGTH=937 /DNA_ID=CAMNT_0050633233 /DNA_START=417 /DNA_END=3227 /DNA_ORIENTATION=-
MARGYVAGGVSFGVLGAVCAMLCGAVPMWLVSRTELVDSFCWLGEGIFETNYRWGNDILDLGIECNPAASNATSTWDAYCSSGQDYSSYRESMCRSTNSSKVLVVLSVVFSVSAVFCGLLAHIFHSLCRQKYASAAATFLCALSLSCEVLLLIIVQASPLFSQEHYTALSKGFSEPYSGISCKYQQPTMHNFLKHQSLDGPMQCLFPGPSFAFCITAIVASMFSMILFGLKWRESLLLESFAKHSDGTGRLVRNASFSPFFGDNVSCSSSEPPTRGADEETPILFSPSIPFRFKYRYERQYSLYGAFFRRFSHRNIAVRHLINSIPSIVNIFHAIFFGVWVLNGTVFATHIEIEQVPHSHHHHVHESLVGRIASMIRDHFEKDIIEKINPVEAFFIHKNFTMLEQIIEFSPITNLQVFFEAGAVFFGLVQLFSVFLWPISKVLVWTWLWYTPADEVFRGRVYSWIDTLGKISLANLFILVLLSLSNHFTREIFIPWYLLPGLILSFHSLRVHIEFSVKSGFGCWGFVVSVMSSMLIGEAYVVAHNVAKRWEEQRREEEARKQDRQGCQGGALLSRVDEEEDDNECSIGEIDTPFLTKIGNAEFALSSENQQVAKEVDEERDESTRPLDGRRVHFADDAIGGQIDLYAHLKSEALCDHIFSPVHHKFHRFSPAGKVCVFVLMLLTITMMSIALFVPCWEFMRSGLIGTLVIPPDDRNITFSVYSASESLHGAGLFGQVPWSMIFTVNFCVILMPLTHVLLLSGAWWIPMRPSTQRNVIRLMEFVSAWSALDIFTICLLLTYADVGQFTKQLMESAGLKSIDEFLARYFPGLQAVLIEDERLLPGYGILVTATILEKVLEHFVQIQFATMIAERTGVRDITKQLEEISSRREDGQDISRNAASNDLIHEHMDVLSPAARYITASSDLNVFYAGLPIQIW